MKDNCMLQNLIQSGSSFNFAEPKGKKNTRANQQQLQLHIGITFNEICQLLEEKNVRLPMTEDTSKSIDKISMFKRIVEHLIDRINPSSAVNESNLISCPDCQTYEASLQKLQNEVRQHIRLQQQLKIFQDTQDDKLDEFKKQRKENEKKLDHLKKQLEESKKQNTNLNNKLSKIESENDHHKKELRDIKRTMSVHQPSEPLHSKRQSHKQSAYAYESKENKIDWMHRNVSIKKDDKEKHYERKSVEKRSESAEKNWRMSNNAKSNKMMSIMNEKMLHDKTKEERRRAIQSKFDYRR